MAFRSSARDVRSALPSRLEDDYTTPAVILKKHIANHVRTIPRSGIRDFFEIVQSMDDVISLGIGEPDFDTPWHIREAAIYSLEQGHTGYTSNLGLPRLRARIAAYVAKHFHVAYDPENEIIVKMLRDICSDARAQSR